MSAFFPAHFASFDPEQRYRRARLLSLLGMIRTQVPDATLSSVVKGRMGFYSATAAFQNGLSILLSTDADLPEALYEVIRFATNDRADRYPFETRASLGFFFADKLSSQAVVDLLKRYSQSDVQPPAGEHGPTPPA